MFRLEKRASVTPITAAVILFLSILAALGLGAGLLLLAGQNAWDVYASMLKGALGLPSEWQSGDFYGISEVLLKASPLLLCSLGVGLGARLRYWNIGAEGQLVAGAVAATGAILYWQVPGGVAIFFGVLGGALWAAIAGLLRVCLNINEALSTLLLNYIAILGAEALYMGSWRDPQGFGFPGTAEIPESLWLISWGDTRLHSGLFWAMAIAVILAAFLKWTRWGYMIRAISANERAVLLAGYKPAFYVLAVAVLAGALSGLAGAFEIVGVTHRLQKGIASGIGYTAVIVAALAQFNPLLTIPTSLAIAILAVGGEQLQTSLGLPSAIGTALTGLILLTALSGQLLVHYRIRWDRK